MDVGSAGGIGVGRDGIPMGVVPDHHYLVSPCLGPSYFRQSPQFAPPTRPFLANTSACHTYLPWSKTNDCHP